MTNSTRKVVRKLFPASGFNWSCCCCWSKFFVVISVSQWMFRGSLCGLFNNKIERLFTGRGGVPLLFGSYLLLLLLCLSCLSLLTELLVNRKSQFESILLFVSLEMRELECKWWPIDLFFDQKWVWSLKDSKKLIEKVLLHEMTNHFKITFFFLLSPSPAPIRVK